MDKAVRQAAGDIVITLDCDDTYPVEAIPEMLALIDEKPGIRAAELCRVLGIKSANMVPLIAELEERGLLERDDHANDKRVRVLHLTEAAREAMPGWWRSVVGHEDRFLHRLTKKERATLLRLGTVEQRHEPFEVEPSDALRAVEVGLQETLVVFVFVTLRSRVALRSRSNSPPVRGGSRVVLCVVPDEPRLPRTSSSGPSKCGVEHFLAYLVALDSKRLLNTSHQARRAALLALAGGAKPGLQLAQLGPGGHVRHGR